MNSRPENSYFYLLFQGSTRNIFGYSFIMSEYRLTCSVDEQAAEELNRDAQNFLCLLTSERKKEVC